MTKIISTKHPGLRVHHGDANVKFVDGIAEVSDDVAARLIELDGIELADGEEPETESGEDTGNSTGDGAAGSGGESGEGTGGDGDDEDLAKLDEAELRALAEEEGIDLGRLQNVEKIRARIAEELGEDI